MSGINILFVGLNYRSINPTVSLLPAALNRNCGVHFYGPGYVAKEVLSAGIEAYVDGLDHVDLIVATKDVAGVHDEERLNAWLRLSAVSLEPLRVSPNVMRDIQDFLHRNRKRVIFCLLDFDVYAIQPQDIDKFLNLGEYFIGWGKGAIDFSGRDGDLGLESYIRRKRAKQLELGLYEKFIDDYRRKIINVGFFVGDNEFAWSALATRTLDVSVPGTRYYRRDRALKALNASGSFKVGKDRFRLPFQIAGRIGLRPWANAYATHLYNLAFHKLLVASKVGVTDGGLINFTIRKFFEIPAAGALMVCWPTIELAGLGFQDGVNCVFVNSPTDVVDVVGKVVKDPDAWQPMASAGRQLVLRRHSTTARGEQICEALQLILTGCFEGARWESGEFICSPSQPHREPSLARL